MPALTPIERAVATYCSKWTRKQLREPGVASVNTETLASSTAPDYAFRYIDITSVSKGTIDWSAVREMRFADAPSRARRVVRCGDAMICSVRPILGSHAYADWLDTQPTVCSTGFAVVRCAEEMVPQFFRHLPFAEPVIRQLIAWQCGTNYPAVNERDIRRLVIPVPSPAEQAAIASLLGAVDVALRHTRAAIKCARVFDHSLLHTVLETGFNSEKPTSFKHPPHWSIRRLDEVAEVGSGVTLGKDVSAFKTIELPYLRVANVQDGHLDLSTIKTVRVRINEVDGYRLAVGDVLMTEGGDIDKLGRGTIWGGQIENCLHQNHIFRIRANRVLLEPEFFSLVVESDIAKRYFNRVAKRTTNLASINKTQVRAFRFPVPPTTNEQRRIVAVMEASKATIASLLSKEAALLDLKGSLMRDLLTGARRVNLEAKAAVS